MRDKFGDKIGGEQLLDMGGRPLSADEYGGCSWDLGLTETNMASRHLLSYTPTQTPPISPGKAPFFLNCALRKYFDDNLSILSGT